MCVPAAPSQGPFSVAGVAASEVSVQLQLASAFAGGILAHEWWLGSPARFVLREFLCCQWLGLAGLRRGIERMFHHAGRTMVVLAQEAPAQNPGPAAEILSSPLFMFGLLGLMFWFMILRPQNRKRREHEAELKKLKVHDRIVTAGGILGTVVEVTTDSDELTIRIDEANNTRMRILRSAISRKVTDSAV